MSTTPPTPGSLWRHKLSGGVVRFADSVRHPGTAPNPFVARGLDDARSDIDRIIDGAADDALDVIGG